MSGTLVGALVTAGLLGVTHAVEPDHVAGISSLSVDSRRSALAGACFSLGHVALVVAWLAVAYALLGRTSFPAAVDTLGTVAVGVLLGSLGAAMTVGGLRGVVRTDEHDHGELTHSHPHLRLPLPGVGDDDHDHSARSYLATGLVGALFTLSPPVSMLVFASTLLPTHGGGVVGLAVLTYALAITATMSAVGAGVGAVFQRTEGRRLHGVVRAVAGVATVGLAAWLLAGVVPTLV